MNAPRSQRGAPVRVFVYGTLLAGEPNHRWLSCARYVAEGRTQAVFELRDLGAFPGLVSGGDHAVPGEVYEVDAETLAALDRLEGHPHFYRRTPITLADGAWVQAYVLAPEHALGHALIESGSWRAHQRERRA